MLSSSRTTVLETPRLRLCYMSEDDLEPLVQVFCDVETMQFYPKPFSREEVLQWIRRNVASYATHRRGLYAVVLKATGEVIGDCGLATQEVEGVCEVEVGYHVRRDLWGQQIATEAASACIEHAFRYFAVPRVISLIRPENVPSRRVAEKNGMTIARQIDWRGLTHFVYEMRREQWRPEKG